MSVRGAKARVPLALRVNRATVQTAGARAAERQAEQVAASAMTGRVAWQPVAAMGGGVPCEAGGPAGEPLRPAIRSEMEDRLGGDFRHVRVHHDATAEAITEEWDADALTHGSEIFFAPARYAPDTPAGRELLAHELVHTRQQAGNGYVPQLQPARRPKSKFDPSRMTDEEKIALRKSIRNDATEGLVNMQDHFDKQPPLSALTGAKAARLSRWRSMIDTALDQSRKVTDARQRAVRVRVLTALRGLLNEKMFVLLILDEKKDVVVSKTIAALQTGKVFSEEQLVHWEQEASWMEGGETPVLMSMIEDAIYQNLGLTPEDLRTPELTDDEQGDVAAGTVRPQSGAGSGTKQPGGTGDPDAGNADPNAQPTQQSEEDRALIAEMRASVPVVAEGAMTNDEAALMAKIKAMPEAQRKAFFEFLRNTAPDEIKETDKSLSMDEVLERFQKMSPSELALLEMNRKLRDPSTPALPLGDSVTLPIKDAVAQSIEAKETTEKIDQNLAIISRLNRDPNAPAVPGDTKFEDLSAEIAMLYGFLGGGAGQSTQVLEAVGALHQSIGDLQKSIQSDLRWLLAETAAMALLPLVGSLRAARLIYRLNQVRKLLQDLKRAYSIFTKVKEVIDLITTLQSSLTELKRIFHIATVEIPDLVAKLAAFPDEVSVEELLEEKRDELLEHFSEVLESAAGEKLAEWLYLPEDTTTTELMNIVNNLPRGFEALSLAWDHYQSADRSDKGFAIQLATKAAVAGGLLFPLVGVFASIVGYAVHAVGAKISAKLSAFMAKAQHGSKQSKRSREEFGKVNRRGLKYDDGEIGKVLKEAEALVRQKLKAEEPEGRWTSDWFRETMRTAVGEVNEKFRLEKKTVKANRKASRLRRRPAGPDQQVPVPPLRVSFPVLAFGKRKLKAKLKLNPPGDVEVDELTDADFAKGQQYTGKNPKRQAGMRRWLRDAGYEFARTNSNDPHLRLPGGEAGKKGRNYLHIDGTGLIRHGIDLEAYKKFLNRTVAGSNELPEGYHLAQATRPNSGVIVKRKPGQERGKNPLKELTLSGPQRKLIEGKETAVPELISPLGVVVPETESYDWQHATDLMFANNKRIAGINDQNKRTAADWKTHINNTSGLKVRPKRVRGRLGYIVRARAFGDSTRDRHLPGLQNRDNKGHIVARRFGGEEPYENLVPMKESLNQFPGLWYKFEDAMAEIYTGSKSKSGDFVTVSMDFKYSNRQSRRPSTFTASWQSDLAPKQSSGGTKTFNND